MRNTSKTRKRNRPKPYPISRCHGPNILHSLNAMTTSLRWDWGWVLTWSLLFAFNLFSPLMFSSQYPPSCLLGIALGIATCWFFGLAFQYFPERFRDHLVIGSLFVACMQFFPLLHVLAGMAAIESTNALTGLQLNSDDASGSLAGFIVAIITGQILLVFSLGIPLPFKLYAALKKANHRHS